MRTWDKGMSWAAANERGRKMRGRKMGSLMGEVLSDLFPE
jgi:hypothetical protein